MSCDATTTKGQKCKNKTSPHQVYCNTHLTLCRDLLAHYKGVCDMVWSKKCLAQMTTQELTEISEYARECARLRSGFQVECCGQKVDKSHLGAIVKMMNIRKKCNLELDRRARQPSVEMDQNSESQEVSVTKRPVPPLAPAYTKLSVPPLAPVSTKRSVPPLAPVSTKRSVPPLAPVSTKRPIPSLTSIGFNNS